MSAQSPESTASGAVVASVRESLAALPDADGLETCIDEGREVAAIVESLGLPSRIVAAAQAYPSRNAG